MAGAIDRYVYVNVMRPFVPGIFLKYSKLEHVETIDEVQHPIIREALRMMSEGTPQIEISALADIPAGTGLGSSGSFTTALLRALHAYRRHQIEPADLAKQACDIEINRLGEPIGKQDQYIAAYGGLTCFEFRPDDSVLSWPLRIDAETLFELEDNLLLFFTGFARSASGMLKDQDVRTRRADPDMVQNLHYVKEIGHASRTALEAGDLVSFARLMNDQWEYKKRRSGGMSNPQIDTWYEMAMASGALGGKLIGAGGGGFFMFYAEEKKRLRHALSTAGLREVRFHFDFEGSKVVAQ